jgi:light-regulated signal transduction histidine kinase (bacteriophytochrome)
MKRNPLFEFIDLTHLLPPQNGLSTLVRKEVSLPKMEEHLEQLIEKQRKSIDIIREIHTMFSRGENEVNAINLDSLIERAIYMLQHVDCLENIDAVVYNESKDFFYGNELMLFSLFTSLIKNSIEYRAKGTLKHWIRVVINDTKQGKQISLFDNGKGIKEEQQEKTFCKIKQSVLELGGSLQISSDTDAGTVIICNIPSSES